MVFYDGSNKTEEIYENDINGWGFKWNIMRLRSPEKIQWCSSKLVLLICYLFDKDSIWKLMSP